MTIRTASLSRSWLRRRLLVGQHPNVYFWIVFLILNALLFLPAFLLGRQPSALLPVTSPVATNPLQLARQLFVWRNNLDIFRLSAELSILMTLWILLPWPRRPRLRQFFRRIIASIYLLALTYAVYESLAFYVYQQEANLYAHVSIFVAGLKFLLKHLPLQPWQILAGAASVAVLVYLLLLLLRFITGNVPRTGLNIWSKAFLVLLALVSLLSMARNGANLSSPKSVVSSIAFKLQRNAAVSIALYQDVHEFEELSTGQFYDYSGHDLLSKPNIYLIFIESYGSILYNRPAFLDGYTNTLRQLEGELEQAGWHAVSALSESPSWGGGSWMAYTSLLFGMRVDSNPQYEVLLERFQEEEYPHLGRFLRAQGYRYIRATSLAAELPDDEWQEYVKFYGVDRWIRYRDLNYSGEHYGWGPSPPDQYVLNALHEMVMNEAEEPFLLFWITQNSHYPWRTLPELVDDWRAMNDGNKVVERFIEDNRSLPNKQADYLAAINYELSFLTDFILNKAEDDAIFILIGDHQPGYVTRRSDGFDTPLHIVSRDSLFLERFMDYGFEQGLELDNPRPVLRHEGFYSLFMHALLDQYGLGTSQIPPYLPNGLATDEPPHSS